jgi:hypothetical protein
LAVSELWDGSLFDRARPRRIAKFISGTNDAGPFALAKTSVRRVARILRIRDRPKFRGHRSWGIVMPTTSAVLGSAILALLSLSQQAMADMVILESNVSSHMVGTRLPDRVPVVLPQCGQVTVRLPSGEINIITGTMNPNCQSNRTPALQINRQPPAGDEPSESAMQ